MIEYVLILAVVVTAAVAVLGMVSSAVWGHLGPVGPALGAEGERPAFQLPVALPLAIVIGALVVGVVGVYVLRLRRG